MRGCIECGKPISLRSRGRCHPCASVDPVRKARIAEGQRKRWARRLADPKERAKAVESGRRLKAAHPPTPEMVAKQEAGRRAGDQARSWCPPEYAALNATLRGKRVPAPERKAMIAAQAAADERARLAAMSGLERQLERVRNGARVVERAPMPGRAYEQTLGGVSGGML